MARLSLVLILLCSAGVSAAGTAAEAGTAARATTTMTQQLARRRRLKKKMIATAKKMGMLQRGPLTKARVAFWEKQREEMLAAGVPDHDIPFYSEAGRIAWADIKQPLDAEEMAFLVEHHTKVQQKASDAARKAGQLLQQQQQQQQQAAASMRFRSQAEVDADAQVSGETVAAAEALVGDKAIEAISLQTQLSAAEYGTATHPILTSLMAQMGKLTATGLSAFARNTSDQKQNCVGCKFVLWKTHGKLDQSASYSLVKNTLENICVGMPDVFYDVCDVMYDQEDNILQDYMNNVDFQHICEFIGVCWLGLVL